MLALWQIALIADEKNGFLLSPEGVTVPADDNAIGKYETGVFDDVSIANKKSYPEELFGNLRLRIFRRKITLLIHRKK